MTDTPPSTNEIWAILREVAVSQRESTARLDRIEALTEANAQAIAQLREENRASIEDLVNMLTNQAEQAERDRLALSAEVRSLVNALRDRFGSNGHAGEE